MGMLMHYCMHTTFYDITPWAKFSSALCSPDQLAAKRELRITLAHPC